MAQVVLGEAAERDLSRLIDFLLSDDPDVAGETKDLILEALSVLQNHPLIGRPAEEDLRELVISRGRSGYVALYEYLEAEDLVIVLAIRHQREAGYPSSG